jgi:hypothetical protein
MNQRRLSRIVAGVLMVVIVASALNIDHVNRNRLGRDAFMEHQSQRYERYFAHPDFADSVLEAVLLCGAFLLIYEVIAFNTEKVLKFIGEARAKGE